MASQTPFFGIDITNGFMRAATCVRDHSGIRLLALEEALLPHGAVVNGLILDPKKTGQMLGTILTTGNTRFPQAVVAGLPDHLTYLLSVNIPNVQEAERQEAVAWEISQHLPLPIDAITFDWSVRREAPNGLTVEVAAAPRDVAESYSATLVAAGLEPLALEPLALTPMRLLKDAALAKPVLLLRMDSYSNTAVFITDNETIPATFTTPTFSKSRIDLLLGEKLKLTHEERTKAVEIFGFDAARGDGAVRAALLEELTAFAQELDTQRAFIQSSASVAIDSVFLIGQPALKGLPEELAQALHVPVVDLATAFTEPVKWKRGDILPAPSISRTATALGLALHPL